MAVGAVHVTLWKVAPVLRPTKREKRDRCGGESLHRQHSTAERSTPRSTDTEPAHGRRVGVNSLPTHRHIPTTAHPAHAPSSVTTLPYLRPCPLCCNLLASPLTCVHPSIRQPILPLLPPPLPSLSMLAFLVSSLLLLSSTLSTAVSGQSIVVHAPEPLGTQRYFPYCATDVHAIKNFGTSVGAVSRSFHASLAAVGVWSETSWSQAAMPSPLLSF